jgi:hypothetical protein
MKNLQNQKILDFCHAHIEKIGFAILSLAWAPLPFYNFDSHHDGLILSTVSLTKTSIINGSDYPFNQYGPIWAIPFLILSFVLDSEVLFIGMRIMTVGFYFLSAFLLWKTSRIFVGYKLSILTLFLFFASQPFTSDFGSDLVPWPSAIVMPLAIATVFLMLKLFDEEVSPQKKWIFAFGMGLLIPAIIGSRLQVGGLLLGVAIYAIELSKFSRLKRLYFLLGLLTSSGLFVLALLRLGWLRSALFDQIIYGSTYLTADKSTFPKPVITFIGIIIFALIFILAPLVFKLKANFKNKRIIFSILLASISSIIIGVYLWQPRSVEPIEVLVILTRRLWITFSLGALVYAALKISIFQRKKLGSEPILPVSNQFKLLALSAICLESQVYPLFDQMHFWWGSPLTFLIVVIVTVDRFKFHLIQPKTLELIKVPIIISILITVFVPWFAQVGAPKIELPRSVSAKIYTSDDVAAYHHGLQQFFDMNISRGERVLNLCEDTDIYFEQSKYVSASRFFVYWGEPMSHSQEIYNSFLNSNPDAIVTCDLTHRPTIRLKEESLQAAILSKMEANLNSAKVFLGEKRWTIYRF